MVLPFDDISDTDLQRAVLNAMSPLPRVLPGPWLSGADRRALDDAQKLCLKWREWLKTQSLPHRVRREYLNWIEFCENDNVAAENEITTGAQRQRFEAYTQDIKSRLQRAGEIAERLPRM